jgi:hypothetical protein
MSPAAGVGASNMDMAPLDGARAPIQCGLSVPMTKYAASNTVAVCAKMSHRRFMVGIVGGNSALGTVQTS